MIGFFVIASLFGMVVSFCEDSWRMFLFFFCVIIGWFLYDYDEPTVKEMNQKITILENRIDDLELEQENQECLYPE